LKCENKKARQGLTQEMIDEVEREN